MLTAHYSNRVESLVAQLAALLSVPVGSPFIAEQVIVQNRGMARWLSLRLADQLGICANVEFPLPAGFIWNVFYRVLPDIPESQPFTSSVMAWRLMKALDELRDTEAFQAVRHYLGGRRDAFKQYELCVRLAQCFDQYLVYRPEWITKWGQGEVDHWQAALWRYLIEETGEAHWVEVQERFAQAVRDGKVDPATLPCRVSLFGISSLSPSYLGVLSTLGKVMDVELFVLNPCREYWGDIVSKRTIGRRRVAGTETLYLESGNSLLASLGRQGRELIDLLQEVPAQEAEHYVEPGTNTLLGALQSDILRLYDRVNGDEKFSWSPADKSLQIHICHSPQREVEILHDQLLQMFSEDDSLLPSDILIMTPDMEAYAPFIDAVFSSTQASKRIPFSIADRAISSESLIIEAFFELLDLPASRFEAKRIMGLLEIPAIQSRFRLSDQDLPEVRNWIRATGIRWGIDAAARAEEGLPKLSEHTWRAGLERMLLGYALPDEAGGLYKGILPYGDIEAQSARLMGCFYSFVETIFTLPERLRGEKPVEAWADTLLEVCDDVFDPDEMHEPEVQAIRTSVEELRRESLEANYSAAVPLAVIKSALRRKLNTLGGTMRFLTGGVTFCAMVPMRSIPFKIIGLIGMNEGVFPRIQHPFGFDLMAMEHRKGDRSSRDEDRYLFLEALLAARQRFYISYVGQDLRDNSAIPPSVVVSEVLDYVRLNVQTVEKQNPLDMLCTLHPLQPFSARYFDGATDRLFSFDQALCQAAQAAQGRSNAAMPFIGKPLPQAEPEWRTVSLEQLIRFFSNPARFLLQQRLGIYLEEGEELLEDREPFDLDFLAKTHLRTQLLELCLQGKSVDETLPLLRARSSLPHGEVGHSVFDQEAGAVENFARKLSDTLSAAAVDSVRLQLPIGGFQLVGTLEKLTELGSTGYRFDDMRPRDWIPLWIRHLALCVCDAQVPHQSHWVAADEVVTLDDVDRPNEHLESLLDLYWRGLHEPLRFFPKSAFAFAKAAQGNGTADPAKAAWREWEGSEFSPARPEKEEPYIRLLFAHEQDPLDAEFENLALQFFGLAFGSELTTPE